MGRQGGGEGCDKDRTARDMSRSQKNVASSGRIQGNMHCNLFPFGMLASSGSTRSIRLST